MSSEYSEQQSEPIEPFEPLKAPFPWAGGKSAVAPIIWERFGKVANYVEPFFGSGAVLLARPDWQDTNETVNDKDCYLANFWRALQADPEGVAYYADFPVNECDLHARHMWLVTCGAAHLEMMKKDPEYYNVKVAGWYVWGLCQWIGAGWCAGFGRTKDGGTKQQLPHLTGGRGVVAKRPQCGKGGHGVHRTTHKIPHLTSGGCGVHRRTLAQKLPHLADNGRGGHRAHLSQQLPHLAHGGMGVHRPSHADIYAYLEALSQRLRRVRVTCGDWSRILGPAVTTGNGLTAVFLDPPYAHSVGRDTDLYLHDEADVSTAVTEWAIANGNDSKLRICVAGYEGEREMPADWEVYSWVARGGYANKGKERNENRKRERLWFSPSCLKVELPLFAGVK